MIQNNVLMTFNKYKSQPIQSLAQCLDYCDWFLKEIDIKNNKQIFYRSYN